MKKFWVNYSEPIIGSLAILFLVILSVWLGWSGYAPPWTGFGEHFPPANSGEGYRPPKTLWDFFELMIIPLFLAVIAYLFNKSGRENERKIEEQRDKANQNIERERLQDNILQMYIGEMTNLLLERGLRKPSKNNEVRNIARVRTLTSLDQLNETRKTTILRFLYEAKLIDKDDPIIKLNGANLSKAIMYRLTLDNADLEEANLQEAQILFTDLPGANLKNLNLTGGHLVSINLRGADLQKANLIGAGLALVDLRNADLRGTIFKGLDPKATSFSDATAVSANLVEVNFKEAKYNSQTVWPDGFDPKEAGAIPDTDK